MNSIKKYFNQFDTQNALFTIALTTCLTFILYSFYRVDSFSRLEALLFIPLLTSFSSFLIDFILWKTKIILIIKWSYRTRTLESFYDTRTLEEFARSPSSRFSYVKRIQDQTRGHDIVRACLSKMLKQLRTRFPFVPIDYSAAKAVFDEYQQYSNNVDLDFVRKQLALKHKIYVTEFRSSYNSAYVGDRPHEYMFNSEEWDTNKDKKDNRNLTLQTIKERVYELSIDTEYPNDIQMLLVKEWRDDASYGCIGELSEYNVGQFRMSSVEEISDYQFTKKALFISLEKKRLLKKEFDKQLKAADLDIRKILKENED